MFTIICSLFSSIRQGFRTRPALHAEILALRHQLLVLQRSSRGHRLRLARPDRLLWVWLAHFWSGWRSALIIVKPETVIAWHQKGFRLYGRWKSRHRVGRPAVSREVIDLIRKMSLVNPRWGAPRIHGELLKLGFELSQATVAKYMVRHRKPPSQTWRTFLRNHMKNMVAADFFVVPTVFFEVLFVFVILSHARRPALPDSFTAQAGTVRGPGGPPPIFCKPPRGTAGRAICCAIGTGLTERSFVKQRAGWTFGKSSRHRNRLGRMLTSSA